MANVKVRDLSNTTSVSTDNKLMVLTNDNNNQVQNITVENFLNNIKSTNTGNGIISGTDGKLYVDNTDTGVIAGTYAFPHNLVVDSKGKIISVEAGGSSPADLVYNPTSLNAQSGVAIAGAGFEETTNKVTTLSSASTNTQYPSAKCVFDNQYGVNKNVTGYIWQNEKTISDGSHITSMINVGQKIYCLSLDGYLYLCEDNENFSNQLSQIPGNEGYWVCLAYDSENEKFIALNRLGYYSESQDCITWTTPTTTFFNSITSIGTNIHDLFYNPSNNYFYVFFNGYIYKTSDFISIVATSQQASGVYSFIYHNGVWVTCGYQKISYSTDPFSSWNTTTLSGITLTKVRYDNETQKFYAIATDGKLYYSDDGSTWSSSNYVEYTNFMCTFANYCAIIFGKYLIVGGDNGGYQVLQEQYTTEITQGSEEPLRSENFDGKPVFKYEFAFSGTAVGSSSYSLRSYLPDNKYPYEILVKIILISSASTQLAAGVVASPYTNREDGFAVVGSTSSASTRSYVQCWIPIGTNRTLYYQIAGSAATSTSYVALEGYRRLGTNI